jgi:hypothetical protein
VNKRLFTAPFAVNKMERMIDLDRNVFISYEDFMAKPIPNYYVSLSQWVFDNGQYMSSIKHWLNTSAKGWVYAGDRKYIFERKNDMVSFVFWLKCQNWTIDKL